MKMFPAVAVTTQVLLGNLCFMPMTLAETAMPMDHDMEEVMEMVMTPMYPMSTVHCDGCVTITRPKHHSTPMTGGMPCNNGHCLSEHSPSTATVTQSSQKDILKIALRPAHFVIDVPETTDVALRPRDGPPIRIAQTRTVVLRE
jgi:hypothetical protein